MSSLLPMSFLQNDQLARYGPSMSALVAEINKRAGEFRKRPIGPLGRYLQVKDPQWIVPIEKAIGGLVCGCQHAPAPASGRL